ncbi:MAG: alpha/beta fold hydrolase [Rhodococcus sp.]|nr:alpha/beta fold hydrolase [Rhodococcus sp. (in: high G+C Gram-positive bacteria)]MCX6493624.1 alpha/beta fold hydrolase [Rhodococcus sp. (in: high G+C Gram-positive bacteria)]
MTSDIDGLTLAHTIRGEGPTLVLIHGIVHRQHAWDSVVDILARHRRVVTVDLPGHGASPDLPTEEFDLGPWIVAELERFLEHVAVDGEKPHVAGNSLGGYFALELAARGSVASATALSPAGFFRGHWDQTRALLVFRLLRALSRVISPIAPTVMRSVGRGEFPQRRPRSTHSASPPTVRSTQPEMQCRASAFRSTRPFPSPSRGAVVTWFCRSIRHRSCVEPFRRPK